MTGTTPSVRNLSRRETLIALGGVGAVLASGDVAGAQSPKASRRRVVRFAHLTDIHVQPERAGDQGMGVCLDHVMAQTDRPEVIVTGGDLLMDIFEQEEARSRLLWDIFLKRCRDHTSLPIEHCLGNHDIWGWNQRKSKTTGEEAHWGKAWALDALSLPALYRAFDRGGWRFIVLDSVQPLHGDGYTARLDDPQFEWLTGELRAARAASKPVIIVSHIPIYSVGALDHDSKTTPEAWHIDGGVMHTDAQKIMKLFREHPCVRLCLSGHIHKLDRLDYEGVTFICGGAVSGAWWKGRGTRCDEGYGLVDLYDDGTFEYEYQRYGWVTKTQ